MNQSDIISNLEDRFKEFVRVSQVATYILEDDDIYPNNKYLPLLVYQGAVQLPENDSASTLETLFGANQWASSWRNGVYGYHHYHSTAHEVLGVFGGTARVQFGGENGVVASVKAGDVVVIPAGVAHKSLGASRDFRVVGAYPHDQRWDLCYGDPGERPQADENIARVALPDADPVYGITGPLTEHWSE
jgi:uncharacterized protein YjlB